MDDIFIKYKMCTDKKRDCRTKRLILGQQAEPILYISVYSVTDLKVANEIIQIAIDEFD